MNSKVKIILLRCSLFVSCILWFSIQVISQPFVDPLQIRYMYGFRNEKGAATPITHLWAGSDLPIKLKESIYLILSPAYEQWKLDSAGLTELVPGVHSISFPVGLLMPLGNSKWSFTVFAIPRWNGEKLFADNTFQFGGAALAIYAIKPEQKFRLGIYVNKEFFGLFVIPLLGVDWRMNEKDYLFGNLPGRLTYEHQWTDKLYGGVTFRSITNSYRLINDEFIRLEDNQLSLYLDLYPSRHLCFTLEAGYGFLRKIRTGIHPNEYLSEMDWGDGLFIKLSGAYRIRL